MGLPGLIPEVPFFTLLANRKFPVTDWIRKPEESRREHGLGAYGAGILSSPGELRYAVESPEPRRLPLDIERVMRTRYKIDSFQQTYFVIDSFRELFEKTAPDFTPVYERVQGQRELPADADTASLAC